MSASSNWWCETDRRLSPARADVAAAHLKGKVEAARFVEGAPRQMKEGVSALRETPSFTSRLETQLLHGEVFVVYDEVGPWAWGQSQRDGYVGFVRAADFDVEIFPPTHRVAALRTIVFPVADIKSQPHTLLSLNAKVAVTRVHGRFAELARGGFAIAEHLTPMDCVSNDWVWSAELFLNTPYLWGGKDSFAVDCSGLVQTALETAGIAAPRDTDMQERALGRALGANDLSQLRRGDLVFWRGHVGIMRDATHLLHASGHHMAVTVEPLNDAVQRIAPTDGPITSIKRI